MNRPALPLTILKTGSAHPDEARRFGDYEDLIATGLGTAPADTIVVSAADSGSYPRVDSLSGVVITGAHEMVTDDPPWLDAVWGVDSRTPGRGGAGARHLLRAPTPGACFRPMNRTLRPC